VPSLARRATVGQDADELETFALGGDLPIRRIGFGAMSITGAGVWGKPADTARAVAVLRAAVDSGVTFIDTADSYGPEVSERLIAEALQPYPSNLVIATKGGYVRRGPWQWQPNGRPEHLRAACEGSLRRLELQRIDLYYLHTPDPGVPLEESVGALSELRREGKIRFVGLSNVGVDGVRRAQSILPIAAVQNRYNLSDRGDDDVVRYCEGEGIAFVAWSPLQKLR
jgi:pyridoxine 4-dehydrogenase